MAKKTKSNIKENQSINKKESKKKEEKKKKVIEEEEELEEISTSKKKPTPKKQSITNKKITSKNQKQTPKKLKNKTKKEEENSEDSKEEKISEKEEENIEEEEESKEKEEENSEEEEESKEEKKDSISEEKEESLSEKSENSKINKKKLKNPKSRLQKTQEAIESLTKPKKTSVIYVGHLPWGFDEKALYKYFSQFGTINRLYNPRSTLSGRSKGYAFIEFLDEKTAEIAAKTMNNYLLFDRILKCNVIEDKSKYDNMFKNAKKKFVFNDKYKKLIERQEKEQSKEEIKNKIDTLLKREEIKREKMKEEGFNINFPGYKGIVEEFKKSHKIGEKKNKESTKKIESVKKKQKIKGKK